MTRGLLPISLALLGALSCEPRLTAFGKACSADGDCDTGYSCNTVDGICLPGQPLTAEGEGDVGEGEGDVAEGEGEAGEGEGDAGEGEGDAGEGEGDAGEGEGDAGEGEGEGDAGEGEGEGEGEGDVSPSPGEVVMRVSWVFDGVDIDIDAVQKDANGDFCFHNFSFPQGASPSPLGRGCGNNAPLDCYYFDCQTTPPDWDKSTTAFSAGDPIMGPNSANGAAPESITIPALASGEYLLAAADWVTNASVSTVTGEIFLDGNSAPVFSRTVSMSSSLLFEEFAKVTKHVDGSVCIEDLGDGSLIGVCP